MVMSVKLTGAEIKKLLEAGARTLPGECGGFVHVSKYLRYTLDADQKPGFRVTDVAFGKKLKPIDLEKEYTCAVTNLLATARGFGTDFVADAPRVVDDEH